jgi:hypothetical protein
VNDNLGRMQQEAITVYFKVLSKLYTRRTDKYHGKIYVRIAVF